MSSSSKLFHLARRDGGVAHLVGVFIIGALILFGAGCKKSSPPPDAGPEVRDPNGAWRTYLPQGYEFDPAAPFGSAELDRVKPLPTAAIGFGIRLHDAPPRLEGGPPLIVIVFPAPDGLPPDWYASFIAEIEGQLSTESVADLPIWYFENVVAMTPGTYFVGKKGSLGFEIQITDADSRTELLPLIDYLVRHLEPL